MPRVLPWCGAGRAEFAMPASREHREARHWLYPTWSYLCTPLSSFSCTTASTDQRTMVRVFQGGATPGFQGKRQALDVMEHMGVSSIWIALLRDHLQHDQRAGQV